tara:strand:- start:596 stop:1354 length:759 start_codon:yes stop_codon:yes gene_type:complete
MYNVVFMTYMVDAPDTLDYAEWCFKSWKVWCKKHDVELFVLEDALQPKGDGTYKVPGMKPTWQRWHVLDVLEENDVDYDQVALVDVDTMIHPNAPNFFEETNREFSGVNDDLMVEWVHNSITGYQDMFPDVKFDWTTYFNCGFIVINKKHKDLCEAITNFYYSNEDELRSRQHQTVKKGSDQTPVNYLVRKKGYPITHLNKKWNFTQLHQRGVLPNALFLDCAWLYHFNGFEKTWRNNVMRDTWNIIKDKYL